MFKRLIIIGLLLGFNTQGGRWQESSAGEYKIDYPITLTSMITPFVMARTSTNWMMPSADYSSMYIRFSEAPDMFWWGLIGK